MEGYTERLDFGQDDQINARPQDIPIQAIEPDPEQPRTFIDRDKLEELAQSMALVGQLHPIGVRRAGTKLIVIYGERRWRAAMMLGWATIQGRVLNPFGAVKLVIQATENMQREELGLEEYARTVLRLVETGIPIAAAAKMLCKNEAWGEIMVSLARDPVAQSLIQFGRIGSVEAWKQFMALPPSSRQVLLDSEEMITGPRCEREGERARRAEAAKQLELLSWSSIRAQTPGRPEPTDSSNNCPSYSPSLGCGSEKDPPLSSGPEEDGTSPGTVAVRIPLALCQQLMRAGCDDPSMDYADWQNLDDWQPSLEERIISILGRWVEGIEGA